MASDGENTAKKAVDRRLTAGEDALNGVMPKGCVKINGFTPKSEGNLPSLSFTHKIFHLAARLYLVLAILSLVFAFMPLVNVLIEAAHCKWLTTVIRRCGLPSTVGPFALFPATGLPAEGIQAGVGTYLVEVLKAVFWKGLVAPLKSFAVAIGFFLMCALHSQVANAPSFKKIVLGDFFGGRLLLWLIFAAACCTALSSAWHLLFGIVLSADTTSPTSLVGGLTAAGRGLAFGWQKPADSALRFLPPFNLAPLTSFLINTVSFLVFAVLNVAVGWATLAPLQLGKWAICPACSPMPAEFAETAEFKTALKEHEEAAQKETDAAIDGAADEATKLREGAEDAAYGTASVQV